MLVAVLALLAALVHVYIFVLESVRWEDPATRRVFGTTEEIAALTQPLAYNQGFYNLFLAIGTFIGIFLLWAGPADGAAAIVVASRLAPPRLVHAIARRTASGRG